MRIYLFLLVLAVMIFPRASDAFEVDKCAGQYRDEKQQMGLPVAWDKTFFGGSATVNSQAQPSRYSFAHFDFSKLPYHLSWTERGPAGVLLKKDITYDLDLAKGSIKTSDGEDMQMPYTTYKAQTFGCEQGGCPLGLAKALAYIQQMKTRLQKSDAVKMDHNKNWVPTLECVEKIIKQVQANEVDKESRGSYPAQYIPSNGAGGVR